jgi:hypothetical protein
MILTEAPDEFTFSSRNPILAHTQSEVGVHITIDRPVGRPGKALSATIKVQDHARNWHRLAFPHLRSAPTAPPAASP